MIWACLFINCRATVFNSVPSSCTPVSIHINLLEDKPGPIENLRLIPKNVSVAVSWSPPDPLTSNGMISGHTISLDGSVVCFLLQEGINMLYSAKTSAQLCSSSGQYLEEYTQSCIQHSSCMCTHSTPLNLILHYICIKQFQLWPYISLKIPGNNFLF